MQLARKKRDDLAEYYRKQPGRKPATVTGGYSRSTGRVRARACSPGANNPCAEDNVVRALGGNKNDIRLTEAIRPRTGRTVPVCVRCQSKYPREMFPKGTPFE